MQAGCVAATGVLLTCAALFSSLQGWTAAVLLTHSKVVQAALLGLPLLGLVRLVASDFSPCRRRRYPSAEGKLFVVTGVAPGGIGYETAAGLLEHGAAVVVATRDAQAGARAAEELGRRYPRGEVSFLLLDLADFGSIRRFCELLRLRHPGRLDGLVCNAGSMMCPYSATAQGLETQCGVNHVGHCFLIHNMAAELAAGKARVVFVSSVAHAFFSKSAPTAEWVLDLHPLPSEYTPRLAYGKSKLANVLAACEYQRQMMRTGNLVVSLHPGEVSTELYRHLPRLLWMLAKPLTFLFMQTPVQGARTSLHCALSSASALSPGAFYMSCNPVLPSSAGSDHRLARDLMSLTNQLFESYE